MSKVPYAIYVGSLMYDMICCRPALTRCMSVVNRYMSDLGKAHWEAMKWVMRYVIRIIDNGLKFQKYTEEGNAIVGYVDVDYGDNIDTRKSLTGYVFTLFGTTITWKSTHQSAVVLSTRIRICGLYKSFERKHVVEGNFEGVWGVSEEKYGSVL